MHSPEIRLQQNDNNKQATMADEASQEGPWDEESPAYTNQGRNSGTRTNDDETISKYEPEGESSEVTGEYEIRKPLQPLPTVVESVTSEEEMIGLAMPLGTPQRFQMPTNNPESRITFETPTKSNLSSRNEHFEDNYQSGAHLSAKEDSERRAVSFQPTRSGVEISHANLSIPESSSGGSSFTSLPSSGSDCDAKVHAREDSLPEPLMRGASKTQAHENNRVSPTLDLDILKSPGRVHRAKVRVRWFERSD
jgi:hypothetical protein